MLSVRCSVGSAEETPYPPELKLNNMARDTPQVPEAEDEPHASLLLLELRSLAPGEKVSAEDLSLRHGLQNQWLDAALSLLARGEPIMIENQGTLGWSFCLAQCAEELQSTRARLLQQYIVMNEAFRGINVALARLLTDDMRGHTSDTN